MNERVMTKSQAASLLTAALQKLEEARRGMAALDSHFTTDEVHLVAMAQYHTGKARDGLDHSRKRRG